MLNAVAYRLSLLLRGQPKESILEAALEFPIELDEADRHIAQHIFDNSLTMTSRKRIYATLLACHHATSAGLVGDFVECGVWRGGNAIAAADVFARRNRNSKVYLFDTFAGMTAPTEHDVANANGELALAQYERDQRDSHNEWCYASLEDVRNNFKNAGVLCDNVRFVKGDVLESLSRDKDLPDEISVLRLDTDWYESTKKELEVLWPRLVSGGILMIDDYGYWGGAKKAVDEFFAERTRPFFSYIDHTGRLAVKR